MAVAAVTGMTKANVHVGKACVAQGFCQLVGVATEEIKRLRTFEAEQHHQAVRVLWVGLQGEAESAKLIWRERYFGGAFAVSGKGVDQLIRQLRDGDRRRPRRYDQE
jgi:hypothetical protein